MKNPPITAAFKLHLSSSLLRKQPPFFLLKAQNELKTKCSACWFLAFCRCQKWSVCGWMCCWIRECMNWWGVRLHTLLWSERWEFKGPAATLNQLMKPLTPLSTCLAVVLFTIPLQLKGWICGGCCRLKPADRKQSENQTLNNSMERFSLCLMNTGSRVRREAG